MFTCTHQSALTMGRVAGKALLSVALLFLSGLLAPGCSKKKTEYHVSIFADLQQETRLDARYAVYKISDTDATEVDAPAPWTVSNAAAGRIEVGAVPGVSDHLRSRKDFYAVAPVVYVLKVFNLNFAGKDGDYFWEAPVLSTMLEVNGVSTAVWLLLKSSAQLSGSGIKISRAAWDQALFKFEKSCQSCKNYSGEEAFAWIKSHPSLKQEISDLFKADGGISLSDIVMSDPPVFAAYTTDTNPYPLNLTSQLWADGIQEGVSFDAVMSIYSLSTSRTRHVPDSWMVSHWTSDDYSVVPPVLGSPVIDPLPDFDGSKLATIDGTLVENSTQPIEVTGTITLDDGRDVSVSTKSMKLLFAAPTKDRPPIRLAQKAFPLYRVNKSITYELTPFMHELGFADKDAGTVLSFYGSTQFVGPSPSATVTFDPYLIYDPQNPGPFESPAPLPIPRPLISSMPLPDSSPSASPCVGFTTTIAGRLPNNMYFTDGTTLSFFPSEEQGPVDPQPSADIDVPLLVHDCQGGILQAILTVRVLPDHPPRLTSYTVGSTVYTPPSGLEFDPGTPIAVQVNELPKSVIDSLNTYMTESWFSISSIPFAAQGNTIQFNARDQDGDPVVLSCIGCRSDPQLAQTGSVEDIFPSAKKPGVMPTTLPANPAKAFATGYYGFRDASDPNLWWASNRNEPWLADPVMQQFYNEVSAVLPSPSPMPVPTSRPLISGYDQSYRVLFAPSFWSFVQHIVNNVPDRGNTAPNSRMPAGQAGAGNPDKTVYLYLDYDYTGNGGVPADPEAVPAPDAQGNSATAYSWRPKFMRSLFAASRPVKYEIKVHVNNIADPPYWRTQPVFSTTRPAPSAGPSPALIQERRTFLVRSEGGGSFYDCGTIADPIPFPIGSPSPIATVYPASKPNLGGCVPVVGPVATYDQAAGEAVDDVEGAYPLGYMAPGTGYAIFPVPSASPSMQPNGTPVRGPNCEWLQVDQGTGELWGTPDYLAADLCTFQIKFTNQNGMSAVSDPITYFIADKLHAADPTYLGAPTDYAPASAPIVVKEGKTLDLSMAKVFAGDPAIGPIDWDIEMGNWNDKWKWSCVNCADPSFGTQWRFYGVAPNPGTGAIGTNFTWTPDHAVIQGTTVGQTLDLPPFVFKGINLAGEVAIRQVYVQVVNQPTPMMFTVFGTQLGDSAPSFIDSPRATPPLALVPLPQMGVFTVQENPGGVPGASTDLQLTTDFIPGTNWTTNYDYTLSECIVNLMPTPYVGGPEFGTGPVVSVPCAATGWTSLIPGIGTSFSAPMSNGAILRLSPSNFPVTSRQGRGGRVTANGPVYRAYRIDLKATQTSAPNIESTGTFYVKVLDRNQNPSAVQLEIITPSPTPSPSPSPSPSASPSPQPSPAIVTRLINPAAEPGCDWASNRCSYQDPATTAPAVVVEGPHYRITLNSQVTGTRKVKAYISDPDNGTTALVPYGFTMSFADPLHDPSIMPAEQGYGNYGTIKNTPTPVEWQFSPNTNCNAPGGNPQTFYRAVLLRMDDDYRGASDPPCTTCTVKAVLEVLNTGGTCSDN